MKLIRHFLIFFITVLALASLWNCDFFHKKYDARDHFNRINQVVIDTYPTLKSLQSLHNSLINRSISPQVARLELVRIRQQFYNNKQAYLNEPPPDELSEEYALLGRWFASVESSFTTFEYMIQTVGTPYEQEYARYMEEAFQKQEELDKQSYLAYANKLRQLGFSVQ